MSKRIEILGVGVNLDHPDVKDAESITDLKKLDLFSHLSEDQQAVAYKELWTALNADEEEAS